MATYTYTFTPSQMALIESAVKNMLKKEQPPGYLALIEEISGIFDAAMDSVSLTDDQVQRLDSYLVQLRGEVETCLGYVASECIRAQLDEINDIMEAPLP